jgi:hypothetical protein
MLTPAYALSAHKSQGMTVDKIIWHADTQKEVSTNSAYVAITRCKYDISVYTDDPEALQKKARKEQEKYSTIDDEIENPYTDTFREHAQETRAARLDRVSEVVADVSLNAGAERISAGDVSPEHPSSTSKERDVSTNAGHGEPSILLADEMKAPVPAVTKDDILGKRLSEIDLKIKKDFLSLSVNGLNFIFNHHKPVEKEKFIKNYDFICKLRDYLKDKAGFEYPIPTMYDGLTKTAWDNYKNISEQLSETFENAKICLKKIKDCGLQEFSNVDNDPLLASLQKIKMEYEDLLKSKDITDINNLNVQLNYIKCNIRAECNKRMSLFGIDDMSKIVNYVRDVYDFSEIKTNITKYAETIILSRKTTPIEVCEAIVKELDLGVTYKWCDVIYNKDKKVKQANFTRSGNSDNMIDGDFSVRHDPATNTYVVNVMQKGETVCLSDKMNLSVKSNFDNIKRLIEKMYWNTQFVKGFNDLVKSREVETERTVEQIVAEIRNIYDGKPTENRTLEASVMEAKQAKIPYDQIIDRIKLTVEDFRKNYWWNAKPDNENYLNFHRKSYYNLNEYIGVEKTEENTFDCHEHKWSSMNIYNNIPISELTDYKGSEKELLRDVEKYTLTRDIILRIRGLTKEKVKEENQSKTTEKTKRISII